jgi:hypothetical protein
MKKNREAFTDGPDAGGVSSMEPVIISKAVRRSEH